MLEKLKKMLEEKKEARSKLIEEMAGTADAEARAAQLEVLGNLDAEIENLTGMVSDAEVDPDLQSRAKTDPNGEFNPLTQSRSKKEVSEKEDLEKRGADLRAGKTIKMPNVEQRAAIATTSGLVIEKKYSRELNPKFNEVSSLLDRVNNVPLQGGESYTKGFEVSGGEGDYTAEGAAATEFEPKYDHVEIAKAKITAYAEITEEIKKLPNIDYVTYISGEVRNALRKKITKQIVAGAGTANTLTGIYNAPANVITAESDLEIAAIDRDTLSNIVFGYGGDESVEGGGVLVLSKKDLQAFSNVRFEDGRKAYKITKNGNTGTIEEADGGVSVEYIISSACNALSDSTTAAATYTMVYGNPAMYELPIFSDIEIKESEHTKFKEGMIAFKGTVYAGGNVAAYNGWLRIKKVTAAAG